MSKVAIEGNSSGTGTFTIASPNSNTNYTLALPEEAGTITTSNSPYSTFRNRIINGDMRIDQRNAGANVTITTLNGQYTLDRWNVNTNQASKVSVQQSTTVPAGFVNSALITSLSAFSSASGDYFGFVQYVEGFNMSDFGWGTANAQTVTLSFKVRASITGTYSVAIGNSAGARSYVATFTVDSANTYETKTITIDGDTSGTWLTDSGRGLRMWFDLGSGSSFNQASPNSWTASNTLRTSGSVSLVGTNGATFYITGVQLEVGSVATPFERRPFGTELMLCERYFQRISGFVCGTGSGSTQCGASVMFKTEMRASPSVGLTAALQVTRVGNTDFTQSAASVEISASGARVNTLSVSLNFINFTGLPSDTALPVIVTGGILTLSSEL